MLSMCSRSCCRSSGSEARVFSTVTGKSGSVRAKATPLRAGLGRSGTCPTLADEEIGGVAEVLGNLLFDLGRVIEVQAHSGQVLQAQIEIGIDVCTGQPRAQAGGPARIGLKHVSGGGKPGLAQRLGQRSICIDAVLHLADVDGTVGS